MISLQKIQKVGLLMQGTVLVKHKFIINQFHYNIIIMHVVAQMSCPWPAYKNLHRLKNTRESPHGKALGLMVLSSCPHQHLVPGLNASPLEMRCLPQDTMSSHQDKNVLPS